MIVAMIVIVVMIGVLFALYRSNKKRILQFEEDVQNIITNHTEFLKSLNARQLKYYIAMDHENLSREISRLEQRVYDLEESNLSH